MTPPNDTGGIPADVSGTPCEQPASPSRRRRLQNRRAHWTIRFDHDGIIFAAGYGTFNDEPSGPLAELFLNVPGKVGAALDTSARDSAVLCSLALQYGCPAEVLRHALMRNGRGEASGALGRLLDLLSFVTANDRG